MLQSKYLLTDISPCKQDILYLSCMCAFVCACERSCRCCGILKGNYTLARRSFMSVCSCDIMSCCAGQFSMQACVSECVCVCVWGVCLRVTLPVRWQVSESNVMRPSPSWFKHEQGKMETAESDSEIKRDWAFSCVTGRKTLWWERCFFLRFNVFVWQIFM